MQCFFYDFTSLARQTLNKFDFAAKILNPNWYIRDLYFFKRSQYPEVRLILMKPEDSFLALQKQELTKKFVEIGKVHLTWAILKNVDMVVQRVVFLHEELMKLPSFPRKALEVDLDLHQGGEYGKVCSVYGIIMMRVVSNISPPSRYSWDWTFCTNSCGCD